MYAFAADNPVTQYDLLGTITIAIDGGVISSNYPGTAPMPFDCSNRVDIAIVPGPKRKAGKVLPINEQDTFEDMTRTALQFVKEDIIVVYPKDSLKEINKQLKEATSGPCDCISSLLFAGHGSAGRQNIHAKHRNDKNKKVLEAMDGDGEAKDVYNGFEIFEGLKFCKPCRLILYGCNVGVDAGVQSYSLLKKRLEETTGCEVFASAETTEGVFPNQVDPNDFESAFPREQGTGDRIAPRRLR